MLPKRLARKTIYESPWINLYIDRVQMPSGQIIDAYHQLDYPQESVVALLLNQDQEICCIQSRRYTTQSLEWELPSGGIERDEDPLEAARREVMEETGLHIASLKHCYTYNPSNGMSNQKAHIVFGEVEDEIQSDYDTDEVSSIHWFTREKVQDLLKKNAIADGMSLLPLLLYLSGILSA